MKTKKQFFFMRAAMSLLVILCSLGAWADDSGSCGTNVTYSYVESTHTLTINGTGDMEDYDDSDAPWSSICEEITTVVIGAGVTSIGNYAFSGCSDLTSVTIPASVTSIGECAFGGSGLTCVTIPASVTSIAYSAFFGCSGLATVTVYAPSCTLGFNAFSACGNLKNIYVFSDLVDDYKAAWSAYENKITAMTPVASGTCGKETPEDVTWRLEGEAGHYGLFISGTGEMADYIYLNTRPWHNYSENIKTIVIENGVTSIGECAFCECNGLTSISIPSSVTSIGNYAFDGCSNLTTVTIPSSVTSIGEGAFNDCEKLTTVSIPASVTSIGNYAFGYCSALTSIEIPASVTTIGEEAFNNTALTSIEIPASVTSIGNGAFIDCEKLTSITVAEGNANYSNDTNGALFNKDKTTLIKYPKGNNADSYVIPASVTSIGEKAFAGCEDLETVTLPDNVTSIGDDAFNNTALTSIGIPASVTSIGKGAFHLCSSLASVALNSNPTIGEEAFFYNTTVTMNLAAAEVGGAHWTTFYNNYGNFQADENTEVYKGTVSGSELVLTPISDKIVNAGNAVILKSTDKPVMTLTTTNSSGDFTDNALKGLSERTEIATSAYSANTIYVMGNTTKNGFGFHKYTGAYMPANKAFLALGSGSSAPLRMVIDDDEETTGVASMADGIDNMSDVWYTLDGRKLNGKPTTKGLYIVNGKKVMIK